ncbi:NADH-quinone oxidoreductase subunit N, partial [archaeon]|nr:NADH-quinone oxidoreductase subunit N [archaeon]
YVSLYALFVSFMYLLTLRDVNAAMFSNFFIVDSFSIIFKAVFLSVAILVTIASLEFIKDERNQGEYYSLLLFATLGMMIVASAGDLITIYVGLELASISTYALVAFKRDERSIEAAMKYFIPSAFFSGLILFGISLMYGAVGTTSLHPPYAGLIGAELTPIAMLAMAFLFAGFGFKMAAVPFQMWVADTYEGAPTPISAFLAAGSKKVAFAAIFRIVMFFMLAFRMEFGIILGVVSIITMTFGNVVALSQKNVKRMLAYSSIAQAGYILVGLAVATKMGYVGQLGLASSMLHIVVHAFMKAGAFIGVAAVAYMLIGDKIDDYIGLSKRAPITAFCMLAFLVSLTGIVPFGGFVSKFLLFVAAVKAGGFMTLLAISLALNSTLSAYYYGRLIKNMYFMPYELAEKVKEPQAFLIPMVICLVILVILGIYPMPFFDYTMGAAATLMH